MRNASPFRECLQNNLSSVTRCYRFGNLYFVFEHLHVVHTYSLSQIYSARFRVSVAVEKAFDICASYWHHFLFPLYLKMVFLSLFLGHSFGHVFFTAFSTKEVWASYWQPSWTKLCLWKYQITVFWAKQLNFNGKRNDPKDTSSPSFCTREYGKGDINARRWEEVASSRMTNFSLGFS